MTREEFLQELSGAISSLPRAERERVADYYSEIILDGMENGKTEAAAVAVLGPVEDIAAKTIGEYGPSRRSGSGLTILKIVALIFGAPLMLCIVLPLAAVAFVLWLVGWVLVACLYIVAVSCGVIVAAAIFQGIILFSSLPAAGMFRLAMAPLGAGLCILFLIAAVKITVLYAKLSVFLVHSLRDVFRNRRIKNDS